MLFAILDFLFSNNVTVAACVFVCQRHSAVQSEQYNTRGWWTIKIAFKKAELQHIRPALTILVQPWNKIKQLHDKIDRI